MMIFESHHTVGQGVEICLEIPDNSGDSVGPGAFGMIREINLKSEC